MLSRSSSSTLLAPPFLPSISTLGPDPTYHHQHPHQHNNHNQHHHQLHHQHPSSPAHLNNHHLHPHHLLHHPHPHHQHQQNSLPHQPMRSSPPLSRNLAYSHLTQSNPLHLSRSVSSSTVSGRPPPKTSRRQSKLNNLDRRRICEYAAAHPKATQEDIAVQWGIDRSSVSKILKYREKWLSISPTARAAKVIKHRGGRFPQLESEVVRRCREKSIGGGFLGDRTIKDVALDVSQEMGLGEGAFKASNGWLDAFKERAQIKGGRFLDASTSMNALPPSDQPLGPHHTPNHLHPVSPLPPISHANPISPAEEDVKALNHEIEDLEEEEEEDEEDEEDEEEEEEEDEDEDEENEQEQEDGEEEETDELMQHTPPRQRVYQTSPRPDSRYATDLLGSAPTPPLSSPNSSNEGGSRGVKMQDLAESLKSPVRPTGTTNQSTSDATTVNTHDRSSEEDPEEADGMDGVEQISSAAESGSGDQTIVFKHPCYPAPNYGQQPPPTAHSYSRPFYGAHAEYRNGPTGHRHTSSSHSRSSSLSIGSLSQQSSIYGDEHHLNSPGGTGGVKMRPGPHLSSYASQPNFHPPPLRTTPVRRTFPSLRHAMSHPAFHSSGSQLGMGAHAPPMPPMSASSTGSQVHQYACFPPHPYALSPVSAPPTHQAHHPLPFSSSRPGSRHEPGPVCGSTRIGHAHAPQPPPAASHPGGPLNRHKREESTEDGVEEVEGDGERVDNIGYDEAIVALKTVMRFLESQKLNLAEPRDYMFVGELYGRMKEKRMEMIGLEGKDVTIGNPAINQPSQMNGNGTCEMSNSGSSSSSGNSGGTPGKTFGLSGRRMISSSSSGTSNCSSGGVGWNGTAGQTAGGGAGATTMTTTGSSSQPQQNQQSQQQGSQQQQQQGQGSGNLNGNHLATGAGKLSNNNGNVNSLLVNGSNGLELVLEDQQLDRMEH